MYKVLIVDDEAAVREGIGSILRSRCLRFTSIDEAGNGQEALHAALDLLPDLVITDVEMPKVDGILFLGQLMEEHPAVFSIIVSGHNEFEYAQKGLSFGVRNYLLKPVEADELAETVNRIADELDKRHLYKKNWEELQQKVKDSLPLYRERFYRDLIEGSRNTAYLSKRAQELGIPMHCRHYAAAILRYANGNGADRGIEEAMITAITEETVVRAMQGMLDVHHFFVRDRQMVLFIGSNEQYKESCFKEFDRFGTRLCMDLKKNMELHDVKMSMGTVCGKLSALSESFRQAEEGMLYSLSMKDRMLLHYEELGKVFVPEQLKSAQLSERLLWHVKMGEREQALEAAREYAESLMTRDNASPYWIKLSLLELSMSILRLLENADNSPASLFADKDVDPYANVYRLEHADELVQWLQRFVETVLNRLEDSSMTQGASYVEKLKLYVEKEISQCHLSLSDLAARLFLSTNYLRQLFRRETGESFVEYVTRVRMEKAQQYLRDPSLKVQEVAEKVGFEDQRYFSSCFKKAFQITPSEYREAIRDGLI